ncbi:hypothetical protein SLEP1_g1500 [Rubroshorea leprosula]|uniref:Uncharacterized protein n=1 Tax=Rubroshorea leprosula TaxID=152421 RepID=A0AAV5HJS2_9ROSI|nr:hypothetical protein SLEP1_g1500 [Rubroshorea leprosula]
MAQPCFRYHLEEEEVADTSVSVVSFQIVKKSIVDNNGIIVSPYLEHRHSFFFYKSPSSDFYVFLSNYMLETGMIEPCGKDLLTHCLSDFKGYFEGNQRLAQEPREFFCCIHRCFRLEDELAAMESRVVQESMDKNVLPKTDNGHQRSHGEALHRAKKKVGRESVTTPA